MSNTDAAPLDGNAAAGAFGTLFDVDVSTVVVTCSGCGGQDVFARQDAYVKGPGVVIRCNGCHDVLARLVRTPDSTWLELSGSTSWRFPDPTRNDP